MKRKAVFPTFILAFCLAIASFTNPVAAYIFTGSGITYRYVAGYVGPHVPELVVGTWTSNARVDTYYHTIQIWWDGPQGWFDGFTAYAWAGLTTIYMFDDAGWSFPCPIIFSLPGQHSGSSSFVYPNYYTTLHILVGWSYVGIDITGEPTVDEVLVGYNVYVGAPGGGGGGCVAEGTLITMADGTSKPVEEIEKGDQVLGFDPTTGSYIAEDVLGVTKTKVEAMVNINNGRLKLTPTDQPIFIRNATYEGWIRDPATIEVGWEIYNATSSSWVPVTSITIEEGKTRVYDLTLDGYTTYIANSILLMDKC